MLKHEKHLKIYNYTFSNTVKMKMAEKPGSSCQKRDSKRNYPKRNISKDHVLRKRAPQKRLTEPNAIYVTRKTNIKALLSKCEKLLEQNTNEIVIHCMGAAIQQGINLSLLLNERYPTFQLAVSTSTVNVVDDLEPITEEADYETQHRQTSALQIKVIRNNLGESSSKQ